MSKNKSYIVRLIIVFGIVLVLTIGFSINSSFLENNKNNIRFNEDINIKIERTLSAISNWSGYEIYKYIKLYDTKTYERVIEDLAKKTQDSKDIEDSIFGEAIQMAKDLEYEYFLEAPDWAIYKYLTQYLKFIEFAQGIDLKNVCIIENPILFKSSTDEVDHEYAYCRMDDALKELIVSTLGSPVKFDAASAEKSYKKFMVDFEEKYQLQSDYFSSLSIQTDSLSVSKVADLYLKFYTELLNQEVSEIANIYKYKRYLAKK